MLGRTDPSRSCSCFQIASQGGVDADHDAARPEIADRRIRFGADRARLLSSSAYLSDTLDNGRILGQDARGGQLADLGAGVGLGHGRDLCW